jgi:hypothetical protein
LAPLLARSKGSQHGAGKTLNDDLPLGMTHPTGIAIDVIIIVIIIIIVVIIVVLAVDLEH